MPRFLTRQRYSPIGLDLGARSVKLVQFTADHGRLVDAARWELPLDQPAGAGEAWRSSAVSAIQQAREGHEFRGRDVVLCLNERQLFLQNIRVAPTEKMSLDRLVQQEAAGRIPFPLAETELRHIEAADVRQGDQILREVILLACHRPALEESLATVEEAGLRPVAVDVKPAAMLRAYSSQFRREEDRHVRSMLVNIGHGGTLVVIVQDNEPLFVKFIELGGRQFDEAVARSLKMEIADAAALRRHNGDRRSDRQDPEIARSVAEATRPVLERLVSELAMCVRYHSVTFRGKPLERLVLSGGESTTALAETLHKRLGVKCELSDPLRGFQGTQQRGRHGQWDIAAGLALRNIC